MTVGFIYFFIDFNKIQTISLYYDYWVEHTLDTNTHIMYLTARQPASILLNIWYKWFENQIDKYVLGQKCFSLHINILKIKRGLLEHTSDSSVTSYNISYQAWIALTLKWATIQFHDSGTPVLPSISKHL